jgi:hypothetical protein
MAQHPSDMTDGADQAADFSVARGCRKISE